MTATADVTMPTVRPPPPRRRPCTVVAFGIGAGPHGGCCGACPYPGGMVCPPIGGPGRPAMGGTVWAACGPGVPGPVA
ncbi:hypothetical protein [Nonomuraea sp. NPDC049625]|uniref:hypothetical protein n=1 Tax=Nonomuraea sp. NPDC049625 TaxID=3155775 RepID=UPI00342AE87A